jgi:hypothetical protein
LTIEMKERKPFVTVVAVIGDHHCGDPRSLEQALLELREELEGEVRELDFVLIANGVPGSDLDGVKDILRRVDDVQVYALARPVDYDVALLAGVENALGDYVLTIDFEFTDLACLADMVGRAREGNDIVLLRHDGKAIDAYEAARRIFYRAYARLTGIDESAIATQRLMSRSVVNYLLQHDEAPALLRRLALQSGFPVAVIPSRLAPRHHRRPIRSALVKAMKLMTSGTSAPLRFMTALSVAGATINIIYMGYVLAIHLFKEEVAPGWVTMSLQISGGFFLISLLLALLSEYILQIHGRTVRQPAYYISQEFRSNRMNREGRLNVEAQAP